MKKIFFLVICLWVSALVAQDRTDTLHVAHYDLTLSIMDFSSQIIEGQADLSVVLKVDNIKNIDLDLRDMVVDNVKVNGIEVSFSRKTELLSIVLDEEYAKGDTLDVRVKYHGKPGKDGRWGGFFFSGDYAFNMGVGMQDVPHNFGRIWYPCLDFFNDKATYTFHIHTKSEHRAVCGGLLTDSLQLEDSSKVWTWTLTDPIPTYLASVAVGKYEVYKDTMMTMDGIKPIEIYVYPELLRNVPGSFANLKRVVNAYEKLFGPYRWQKIGYVTVDFSSGAMEHATNIAYPVYAVDGTENYQSLWAHELSHAWFGNLVTCAKVEEMWINEGFASYCELLVKENLEGTNAYIEDFRSRHADVLKNLLAGNEGYYALNQVPMNKTYGITSYDKGALVVHSFRNYLGDSLFFMGVKSYLQKYAFQNCSSRQLIDCFAEIAHTDLSDFYEGWINQPGFIHFSIDSIRHTNDGNYIVNIRQKVSHAEKMMNRQKVDLTFFSKRHEPYCVRDCFVSGELTEVTLSLPFAPEYGIVDYESKMADAQTDDNLILTKPGSYVSVLTDAVCHVISMEDSVQMRIEHIFASPDIMKQSNDDVFKMSDVHYWRVEYIASKSIEGQLKFHFAFALPTQIDYEMMRGYSRDQLVLLYRRDVSEEWKVIPFTRSSKSYAGYVMTQNILPGEYALAAGNAAASIMQSIKDKVKIYPNPTYSQIKVESDEDIKVVLMDAEGKILLQKQLTRFSSSISLSKYASGVYYLKVYDLQENHIATEPLVKF